MLLVLYKLLNIDTYTWNVCDNDLKIRLIPKPTLESSYQSQFINRPPYSLNTFYPHCQLRGDRHRSRYSAYTDANRWYSRCAAFVIDRGANPAPLTSTVARGKTSLN